MPPTKKTVTASVATPPAVKASRKPAAKAPSTKKVPVKAKVGVSSKAAATPATKTAKPVKVKKPKMVRDSLTIPKLEYAVLDVLKLRAAKLERPVKKTELIRAGIKALAAMADAGFLTALKAVPSLKTGRPSNQ